jgi:flotillin
MNLAGLLIPVVIVGLAATLLGVVITFARNYVKCAPNEVLVVFGKKKGDKGYRLITGGATFVWPVFEAYQRISLDTFQVEFAIEDSPNIDGVPVTVQALANLKISSEPALLSNAVERLLELGNDPKRLEQVSRSTLEGQLRMIVGTLKVEEIIQDREKISGQVLMVSKGELNKLGLEVDIFVIQKISDSHGYIEALGKKATAEVKRDANIGEAEADRDATIRTADARRDARKRAAAADQDASIAEAQAAQAISDADRERDEQIARNAAKVKSEQARIEIAAQTAAAEESKRLKVAQVSADEAEIEARTKLQNKERERKDAEMRASVIVSAEREKEALLIRAGAEQEAAVMQGEAARVRKEKEGEGERAYLTAQAIGRKAAAEANLAEKEAEANGQKAVLLASAEGTRAQGEADGTAVKAKLLAEAEGSLKAQLAIAEGILKKNEAMAQMSPEALRIITLELLPSILEHSGTALEKALGAAMEPVGQGLAAVDSVHVIDMGGGSGDGANPLSKLTGVAPAALVQLLTSLRAVGIDPTKMLGVLGLDVSEFEKTLGTSIGVAQSHIAMEADEDRDGQA